jgi:hypothetical protein
LLVKLNIIRHLKPGAWIEHVEYGIDFKCDDGTLSADSPLHTISEVSYCPIALFQEYASNMKQLFRDAGEITGQVFDVLGTMRKDIEDTGFTNIHERVYKDPIGSWPADPKLREVGKWTLLGLDLGLEGYALATLTRVLGVSLFCFPSLETGN